MVLGKVQVIRGWPSQTSMEEVQKILDWWGFSWGLVCASAAVIVDVWVLGMVQPLISEISNIWKSYSIPLWKQPLVVNSSEQMGFGNRATMSQQLPEIVRRNRPEEGGQKHLLHFQNGNLKHQGLSLCFGCRWRNNPEVYLSPGQLSDWEFLASVAGGIMFKGKVWTHSGPGQLHRGCQKIFRMTSEGLFLQSMLMQQENDPELQSESTAECCVN